MAKALILAAALALASCSTTKGSFCQISKPLRLSGATIDAMTDAEVAAALSHNQKLQRICKVQP
jgi:hypothetical protein